MELQALHNTLARETGKILRQEAALASTKALIVILQKEIALETGETQDELDIKGPKK